MTTLVVLAAGGAGAPCAAAQQAVETPEQVAVRYMGAIRSSDWAGAAALMHPEALRELHELFRPILEAPEGAEFRRMLLGVNDVQEAVAASDTLVFVSLMRLTVSQESGLGDALRSATARVLGTVPEGPDTAHVVARMTPRFRSPRRDGGDILPPVGNHLARHAEAAHRHGAALRRRWNRRAATGQ
jgi:hypothetical protein